MGLNVPRQVPSVQLVAKKMKENNKNAQLIFFFFFILKKKHLSLKLKKTQINLEHHLQKSKHLVESVPLNCQISKTSLNLEVILVLLQFNITQALSKQNKQFV